MPPEHPSPPRLAIGVDLGGTKIAAGLFDASGKIIGSLATAATEASGPGEKTLENLQLVIARAAASCPVTSTIAGIGIGSTGPLDPDSGVLLDAESLPNLRHTPLRKPIEDRFGLPVLLTNDGNAFALAEALHGAGKGCSIVVGVTLGTGCGCGIVIEGRILEGATANTGEVYRAPVAGRCFDEILSGRGLEAAYLAHTGRYVPGRDLARLADAGDPDALRAFGDFGRNAGEGLGIIAALVDPAVIVLGGSVSGSFRHFHATLRQEIARRVAPQVAEHLRVAPASLGDAAGAVGGAALVFSGKTIR